MGEHVLVFILCRTDMCLTLPKGATAPSIIIIHTMSQCDSHAIMTIGRALKLPQIQPDSDAVSNSCHRASA